MRMITKNILLLLSLLFATLLNAQNLPINEKTNKVTFMDVVDAKGLTAKELYTTLKEWATTKGWTVEEANDTEMEITYNANVKVFYPDVDSKGNEEGAVSFKLFLYAKEGKYRYIFTDFEHEGVGKNPNGGKLENTSPDCGKVKMSAKAWVMIKNKTQNSIEELVASLKQRVLEVQNDPTKSKDW